MTPETRAAANKILIEEMNNAITVIKENKKSIDMLSKSLINKNHLTSNETDRILKR